MNDKNDEKSEYLRQIGLLSAIPILMVVGPLVGFFIGSWIDNWAGTDPWFKAILIILGFVASGKEIYNIVRRVNKSL
jgi:F0F1-type ATP synthase assembly protein I